MHAQPCRRAGCVWHPEFVIEAVLLGGFMVSAIAFAVVLEHPASPLRQVIASTFIRRLITGLGMGATAIALIYSPWGQRSGAHLNPAVTITFARLGLVCPTTAAGYVAAQFIGGVAGVLVARLLFGDAVADQSVRYAVTVPGASPWAAFVAELAMTATLMSAVLAAARHRRWRMRGGLIAAACVALFITIEAPVSGMSLNPARTLASAVWAREFTALWIYFVAPASGMLLAAEVARLLHPPTEDEPWSTTT
jgi:aquaporin Z